MSVEPTGTLAERSLGRLHDAADGIADDVKAEAKSKLRKAKGAAHDAYDRAVDKAHDRTSEVRGYLQERSWLTLGVGVALGVVMSLALRGGGAPAAKPEGPKTRH